MLLVSEGGWGLRREVYGVLCFLYFISTFEYFHFLVVGKSFVQIVRKA